MKKLYHAEPAQRLTKVEAGYERLTATHEAAHACISIELRLPFRKVDIVGGKDYSGMIYNRKSRAIFPNDHTNPRVVDWVERNIITSFAGGLAERRFAPRSRWADAMGRDGLERDYYYDEDGDLVCFTSARIACGSDLQHINERLKRLGRHGDEAYQDFNAGASAPAHEPRAAVTTHKERSK